MTRTLITLLCLSVMAATLPACGKKGPVRPKLLPVPAAPAELTVEQRGPAFLLSWLIPERNQDESPLKDLQGFAVERMVYPAGACPDCRDDFKPLATIDLEFPRGVRQVENRLFWADGDLSPGLGYRYRVIPFTRSRAVGAPATVIRTFFLPPPTPEEFAATGHDHMVRLTWTVPFGIQGDLVGFNIYRRQPGEPPPLAPFNSLPLTASPYEDFAVENGRQYLYAIATVTQIGEVRVESAPLGELAAEPRAGR